MGVKFSLSFGKQLQTSLIATELFHLVQTLHIQPVQPLGTFLKIVDAWNAKGI